ncbi:MGMT family protein [Candidatus Bathyarchaeota archaeon]|nr:MGMT family protein [Candidatus Bathyarchaeota archaeon]
MKTRMSWREKLEKKQEPKIVDIPPKMVKRLGTGKMLIPRPLDVDALIRKVKKGKLVTQAEIRERLAKDFGVDVTCPITTGIFVRIAAEAAEEDLHEEKKRVTPYWRVLKKDGGLNPKFPGGVEAQAARLKEEGHVILVSKGKKPPRVKDFEKYLQRL